MKLRDYERRAMNFAEFQDPDYPFYAIVEEVGELFSLRSKHLRGDPIDFIEYNLKVKKELGDILWQLTALCIRCGYSLQEVAEANISKLESRKQRGVIKGSGDER